MPLDPGTSADDKGTLINKIGSVPLRDFICVECMADILAKRGFFLTRSKRVFWFRSGLYG